MVVSGSGSADQGESLSPSEPTLPACPVVAIGASAGGVDALQALFQALPTDLHAAFVVIVHLDPGRESELADILSRRTAMPVAQVSDALALEPNHVYVIPPNRRLLISDHDVATAEFDEPRGHRLPIDLFFRSMAEQRGDGVAIVLTGSGSDGAVGIRAVKESGGVVLVQEPREASYSSMPNNAIATGVADFVLPVQKLATRLVELLKSKAVIRSAEAGLDDDQVIGRILAVLRARTGHDFAGYKRSTVVRRLARRMQISKTERLQQYLKYLQENPEEVQALFADLLISVTAFFRDADAFEALATDVIPKLFDTKSDDSIRVWVPGCATGEEAYSVGMLFLEERARRDHPFEIQIFASDLDLGALATAREGRYPLAIEADVSDARLRQFFVRESDHYRVTKELRDIVLFATHSLLKDPPFSKLDLVSCRNLLIYLDRDLQRQACNTLAYALRPGGFLFLGSAEGIEGSVNSIRVIDRQARIFQTTERTRAHLPDVANREPIPHLPKPPPPRAPREYGRFDEQHAHRQTLEALAPPSILVDSSNRVIHLSESAGRYLLHPGGPLTSDLTELARPELRLDLRAGLHRAFEMNEASLSLAIPVQFNGHARQVCVQVRPVPSGGQVQRALVLFIEGHEIDSAAENETALAEQERGAGDTVRQLREELNSMAVRLRESRQQYSEALEELRAANEELQSANEEYRSTSEELETSKEELQSTNEELQTVNNELKQKLASISRAHSDIENLITSSDVGTLFLDRELRINRFTPQVSNVFSLKHGDEGRPITDFTHRLDYDDLAADAQSVMDNLAPIEHEVRSRNEGWYLTRLRPYRSTEDKIEGVVVTFVDITERRFAENALRQSQKQLEDLIAALPAAVYTTDAQGRLTFFNQACIDLAGRLPKIGSDEWCVSWKLYRMDGTPLPHGECPMAVALRENRQVLGVEILAERPDGTRIPILPYPTPLRDAAGNVVGGVNMLIDISERKAAEQHQQMLINELNHRVKNTLATVQAVASQSFRRAASLAQARESFEARLKALSAAHDVLTRERWEGASLEDIVIQSMAAHSAPSTGRYTISGPDIRISPKAAVPLAMALHELATNAAKYGALSNEEGRVTIDWEADETDDVPRLKLRWSESGGPRVVPPKARGFGSRLIERGLAQDLGGQARIEFPASGVICTIDVPLGEIAGK